MPSTRSPRKSSLQFWPRKRAQRTFARVRAWARGKEAKPLGFAGYKVGMGHIMFTQTRSGSPNKGRQEVMPITIIECPPLKVAAVTYYQKTPYGTKKVTEVRADSQDKHFTRRLRAGKSKTSAPEKFDDVRLVVHTQPALTGIGKKKPEVFEIALGGSKDDKAAKATELLGKEIAVSDVFSAGNQVDTHAITKGKGFQGPVKRHGVAIRHHKSEKTKRGPANVGPWTGNRSWTVAHAGQMGYFTRTEYNKHILEVSDDIEKIARNGGIKRYGNVKNSYIIVKGSIAGTKNRLIRFNEAIRPNAKLKDAPKIEQVIL